MKHTKFKAILSNFLLIVIAFFFFQSPPFTILNQPAISNRPYPVAYYNQQLPGAGSGGPLTHLMPNSANVVGTVMRNGGSSLLTSSGAWHSDGTDDFQARTTYYGQSSDPVYQITGCTNAAAFINGTKFHAPNGAPFNPSTSDENLQVWDQTTNQIIGAYQFGGSGTLPSCPSGTLSSPCNFPRENGYCSLDTRPSGKGYNAGTAVSTAGLSPTGNNIRLKEILNNGHIPHGLRLITTCNDTNNGLYSSKLVFPANQGTGAPANNCAAAGVSATNRPPNGALFFLDYTNAQLDCFNPAKAACTGITKLDALQFMFIEAMTLYGGTIEDTGNSNSLSIYGQESETPYRWYETHGYPGAAATANSFDSFMAAHCTGGGTWCFDTPRSAPHSLHQWNMSAWANISLVNGGDVIAHMHVADQCVAIGLQGLASVVSNGVTVAACTTPQGPVPPTNVTATVN